MEDQYIENMDLNLTSDRIVNNALETAKERCTNPLEYNNEVIEICSMEDRDGVYMWAEFCKDSITVRYWEEPYYHCACCKCETGKNGVSIRYF